MAYPSFYQASLIDGLLQKRLEPSHELLVLAEKIDWGRTESALRPYYSLRGRKAKSIRLMVGLQILKHRFDLSDEDVVQGIRENVYWMAFCGLSGQLGTPDWGKALDASTLCKFRKRIGAEGVATIERVIREQLIAAKEMSPKTHLVDSTAMEKNITYPTDTGLLDRGRQLIVKTIRKLGELGVKVKVRDFARKAKKAILNVVKLGKDRQERIERGTKDLIGMAQHVLAKVPAALKGAGAVAANAAKSAGKAAQEALAAAAKDGHRKVEALGDAARAGLAAAGIGVKDQIARLTDQLKKQRELLRRVINQAEARWQGVHVPNKVLSLHEPQVVAIPKGKRAKPNEYGSKVSISIDAHGYVVGHQEYAENIADTKSLDPALDAWEEAFGKPSDELGADRGYHTPTPSEKTAKIKRVAIPRKGSVPHPDKKKPYFRRLQRRRAGIEPVIGHLKSDHRMDCSRYKGFEGDRMNVSWAVIAWNTKKWVRRAQGSGKKAQDMGKKAM
jgi:IS5 family transposase